MAPSRTCGKSPTDFQVRGSLESAHSTAFLSLYVNCSNNPSQWNDVSDVARENVFIRDPESSTVVCFH